MSAHDWERAQADLRRRSRRPFTVKLRTERLARMDAAHKAAFADWPLSEDELSRRAAADARPADVSWQADAVEPDCPACHELPGRACAGHLGAWQDRQSRSRGDCQRCGGERRELVERDDGSMSWRACPECNAAPALPAMIPGGLAERAFRAGRVGPVSGSRAQRWASDARSIRYWASDEAKERPGAAMTPKPGAGARFGLAGLHCDQCGFFDSMPAGSWGDWQGPLPLMACPKCGSIPLGVIWPPG
jgi:hypothetical protein